MKSLKTVLSKLLSAYKKSRKYLGYAVIIITALLFYIYIKGHPEVTDSLRSIPFWLIPVVLLFYTMILLTNIVITVTTIKMCEKTYSLKDSLQLTIYSTLINFFGPLQSGPGFRAVYLKKKINLSIKEYTKATLVYYLFFAIISLVFLFGMKYKLLTLAGVIVATYLVHKALKKVFSRISPNLLIIIFLATLVQIASVTILYYAELKSLGYSFGLAQILAYTGAANLALFVALTPAAIGIRESFLLLSSSIHGIPAAAIVSAGLVDRAIYFIFLIILFAISSLWHIQSKLNPAGRKA